MAVRFVVELEDAVARCLEVVASSHELDVAGLLAAAGRHVARTQGGLRQPRVMYRTHVEIPDPPARPDWVTVVSADQARRDGYKLSAAALAKQADAVRIYIGEKVSLSETGKRIGLSEPTVRKLITHAGYPIRPKGWIPGNARSA